MTVSSESCSCLCTTGDGCAGFHERRCVARKPHQCPGCETKIRPGDPMVDISLLQDEDDANYIYRCQYHAACNDMLCAVAEKLSGGEFQYGCSFVDCIDDWALRLDPKVDGKLIALLDEVFAIMDRNG
jgi:hypothetical protein